ncbi:MAG: hypothetical protein V4525_02630 [Pseudomonadota bacterium]
MRKPNSNIKLKSNAIVPDFSTFKQRAESQRNLFGIQNNFNPPFLNNANIDIEIVQIRTHIIQK